MSGEICNNWVIHALRRKPSQTVSRGYFRCVADTGMRCVMYHDPTEPLARDEIQYIYVQTGTLQCIDENTLTVVAYGSVYDNTQDADGDGLPDDGEAPVFSIGPLTGTTNKRLPMLPPGIP